MKFYLSCLSIICACMMTTPVQAQVSIGADFVSRYVWRGFDFGESFSIQPALTLGTASGFEVGAWGSYATSPGGAGANELDLWIGYSTGNFSIGLTDYYFPSPGGNTFFDFDEDDTDGGAHFFEPYASYTVGPVTLYGAVVLNNLADDDSAVYLEASLPLTTDTEGVELGLVSGFVLGESQFYGTNTTTLVNLGLNASSEVTLGQITLPVFVGYVLNATPGAERTHLVFGFSLSN